MNSDIERVLLDRNAIAQRVRELAQQISDDLEKLDDSHKVTLIPILTGSIIFVSDLIREMPQKLRIHMLSVASYPGTAMTSRGSAVRDELTSLPESLEGQHVIIVDDILDSGGTLRLATDLLKTKAPASVRTCVLLRKLRPEAMAFPADYVAFDIPDEFVVGYGLDYDDLYRNLPEIATLTPEAIERVRQEGLA